MTRLDPVRLDGNARQRGQMQARAEPGLIADVQGAIMGSLRDAAPVLSDTRVRNYLAAQWDFTERHGARHMDEIAGLADGFGYAPRDLFDFLHLSFLKPDAMPDDGCSTIALSRSADGPLLAKNRDYGGNHHRLQRVFLHSDPAFGDRRCLCVGSLGCPGAFSSGMNSDGLAIVDTRVDAARTGVGWLRYFLMTELLWSAATVAEAVNIIRSVPHVGGGSLGLADATGCIATVELGHPEAQVETRAEGGFVHTNHFLSAPLARPLDLANDPYDRSSAGRLGVLSKALPGLLDRADRRDPMRLLASHGDDDHRLCQHAEKRASFTISSVVYLCRSREMYFSGGPPCRDDWQAYAL